MKVCTIAALPLIGMLVSVNVFAQSCASPLPFNTPANGPSVSANTCTVAPGVGANSVDQYCGALDSAGKPDVVYSVTLAAQANRTIANIAITGGAAGFTPSAFLYSAGCATGDGCAATGDSGTAMTISTPAPGVAAGTYFLAISASPVDASGACGAFTVTADGTLPVALQKFSVE